MIDLDIGDLYECLVIFRPTHKGRPLKDKVKTIDRSVLHLRCLWRCDKGEAYEGEYAMGADLGSISYSLLKSADLLWVASGDLNILGRVEED